MGTDVEVTVVGPASLAQHALDRLADLEARWSRFRADSEVSALNRSPGSAVAVSADTRLLVTRAVAAWRLGAGFADCTLLDEVVAAGYDRSFEDLPAERTTTASTGTAPTLALRLVGPDDIRIDATTVTLPAEVRFDPGGVGKGVAADLVSAELVAAGAHGVCVDVGGDLRVRGEGPDGGTWTISVDHPRRARSLALVGLVDGAVATSTTLLRRWRVDGQVRHHLIDPRTRRPADSSIAFCSVVAGDAWVAETLAKAVLVRGGPHPFDLVDGSGAEALVVERSGAVRTSEGFRRFTGGTLPPPMIEEVA